MDTVFAPTVKSIGALMLPDVTVWPAMSALADALESVGLNAIL